MNFRDWKRKFGRVQTLLDSLLSEKQRIETYIQAHTTLLSPMRQIPQETLTEIFIHCLPAEPSLCGPKFE
ncbi:hypothetical protein BT96DRAFT_1084622 [Gymnopus androsaceus JB14]|uniref:F-box domain-containing protein n=1 Tax=Gymnopus androsaceus JB14 TaxID=1447944 RepID=A0A6A4IHI5_9AGAR|nr:hypothetical protein BT96DRAFT_1084622 [Gymnopus androsaceus JB14]